MSVKMNGNGYQFIMNVICIEGKHKFTSLISGRENPVCRSRWKINNVYAYSNY